MIACDYRNKLLGKALGILQKKFLLKILQCLQENTCVEVYFINNSEDPKACNYIKKRLQHKCLPVNTAKFLRTTILNEICESSYSFPFFPKV